MSPPSFADLGKSARDLFTKGYRIGNYTPKKGRIRVIYWLEGKFTKKKAKIAPDVVNVIALNTGKIVSAHGFLKFDSTTVSGAKSEIQFKTGASHNLTSQKLNGNLEVQYKAPEYGVTVTEKWNTENVLGTTVEVKDQFARGLKITLDSTYIPHSSKRDAVVKSEWANDLLKLNANLSLYGGPVLTLSAVTSRQDWLLGVQSKLDLSTNEHKAFTVAFGRVTPDYALHSFSNDGREFGASFFHKVHRNLELGAQLGWTIGDSGTKFGLASKYAISKDLILRAKVDNKSTVALAATHDLNNGCKLTLTSQFGLLGGVETQDNKFGVGLEYSA